MSEEKKAIFLKGYFTANELMRIADEMMHDEFTKAPSQDELWEEVVSVCLQNYGPYRVHPYDTNHEEFKKRYRITRI